MFKQTNIQSVESVRNCNRLCVLSIVSENRIISIRGMQIIVDRDLANMYGVDTKRLNEQVRRNIERFPISFRFQLTKEERDELVANCDRFESLKHSIKLPYAFTEQGVAMLSLSFILKLRCK